MLNPRVVECECRKYEVVESKVVESKFVEFMLHSRRGSSGLEMGDTGQMTEYYLKEEEMRRRREEEEEEKKEIPTSQVNKWRKWWRNMWKAPRDIYSDKIDSAEEARLNAIKQPAEAEASRATLNKKLWKPRPQE